MLGAMSVSISVRCRNGDFDQKFPPEYHTVESYNLVLDGPYQHIWKCRKP